MGLVLNDILKRFRIQSAPTKPQRARQIVRVPDSETVVVELDNGRYVIARQLAYEYAYPLRSGKWSWHDGWPKALHRLGVLTKEDVEAIKRDDETREREYQRQFGREQLERAVQKLGIELTEEQKRVAGIKNAESADA